MLTNYELRQRMRKVIRPNLQVLLVIALIASLPGLLVSVVTTLTGTDVLNWLYAQGIDNAIMNERLMEEMQAFLLERGWVSAALSIVQALVTPVLILGLINAVLTLLRGGTAVVATAFSRLNVFLRSVGVSLWVSFRIFLWELPGLALYLAAAVLAVMSENLSILFLLMTVASVLVMVLTIRAAYRYALSLLFLADDPETGVFECVRKSSAVMKGRILQLLSLELPYMLGGGLIGSLIAALLGGVIGNTLSMMVQLIFTVFYYGARCVFYEAYARPEGGRAHAFQSDPFHNEMTD